MKNPDTAVLVRRWSGWFGGMLCAIAALSASEAVARVATQTPSPFLSVANRAVDLAPRPVKEFAVASFGTADKPVLIGGILVTVLAAASVIGRLGLARPRLALGLFAGLPLVATVAVLTDRTTTASPATRLVPAVVLAVVGIGALALLLRSSAPGTTPGRGTAIDRRGFLRFAAASLLVTAAAGAVTKAYGGLAAAASRAGIRLPAPARPAAPVPVGAEFDVDGITPHLTSNKDFYRVDTALRVPDVPAEDWSLRIHGLVDREIRLSFRDLLQRPLVEKRITLTCVSNPVGGDYLGNAVWLGVPIASLLAEAGVDASADAVKSTSADGWSAGTPLSVLADVDREALIAVGMNGEPLPLEHGFPARMVVPGLYGYVSATKWLVDLEVTRFADFEAYWTSRGYAAQAPIKTSSRIDVPRAFAELEAGRNVVAGVAWSQSRGVAGVEVRVDGGAWSRAELAAEDSIDTWRQWRWVWDATPGTHLIEVRATDATGVSQTADRAPIAPDGSTGWHSVTVTVS